MDLYWDSVLLDRSESESPQNYEDITYQCNTKYIMPAELHYYGTWTLNKSTFLT